MVSALEGNRSQELHLSLRQSVCEGVKVMYNNYQNKGSTTIRRKTLRRIRHLVELDNWSNVTFGRNGQSVESYFSSKCV